MSKKLYALFLYIMDGVFSMAAVYAVLGGLFLGWGFTFCDELEQQCRRGL